MSGLTVKQRRFIEEYLADPNATQAAIRAGYSHKAAYAIGAENLKKPQIAEALEAARAELSERTGVYPELVLEEYKRLAFSDLRDAVNWSGRTMQIRPAEELAPDAARALQEVSETVTETPEGAIRTTRKVKLHDKLGALRDVAKILGMFPKDGSSVNVNVNVSNQPVERPLKDFTAEELEFYERMLGDAPEHARNS